MLYKCFTKENKVVRAYTRLWAHGVMLFSGFTYSGWVPPIEASSGIDHWNCHEYQWFCPNSVIAMFEYKKYGIVSYKHPWNIVMLLTTFQRYFTWPLWSFAVKGHPETLCRDPLTVYHFYTSSKRQLHFATTCLFVWINYGADTNQTTTWCPTPYSRRCLAYICTETRWNSNVCID